MDNWSSNVIINGNKKEHPRNKNKTKETEKDKISARRDETIRKGKRKTVARKKGTENETGDNWNKREESEARKKAAETRIKV
jgi:hypothetical protein